MDDSVGMAPNNTSPSPTPAPISSRTTTIIGREAVERAIKYGVPVNKYEDPIEGAASDLTAAQANAVIAEDPSLLWADVPCCDHATCEADPTHSVGNGGYCQEHAAWALYEITTPHCETDARSEWRHSICLDVAAASQTPTVQMVREAMAEGEA